MNILRTKSKTFQQKVKDAPQTPGCYIYFDVYKKVIYVGKAKNIKNRVKSYFSNYTKIEEAKQQMIALATDVKFYEVDSEFEALILETNLIKKYLPKYNVLMKDDKNYIYVRFGRDEIPSINIVRQKKNDNADYFGPYPSALPVKRVLIRLRRLFPYCMNSKVSKKPCFYYHIGLCNGICAELEDRKQYLRRVKDIKKFFQGKKVDVIRKFQKRLQKYVKDLNFEEAAILRDRINDLKYVGVNISIDREIDDVLIESLKKIEHSTSVDQLVENLAFPSEKLKAHNGFRIECFDISNIQGTNATGSMTVVVDGKLEPSLYRRFKIRMKNEPNDFAMLQEVLARRFKQFLMSDQKNNSESYDLPDEMINRIKNWKDDESFSKKPDLIIIDGGKGQLASTYKILYNFGLHNEIPIVGLAKREEEIFKLKNQFNDEYNPADDSSAFERILLPRRSQALFLVQRIRDEAHRFAITYHRKLRSKKMLLTE